MVRGKRNSVLNELLPFLSVAEQRSFTKAASKLGMDTSSVSRAVTRLERHTGARLFARTSRSVALTAEGELVLASARELIERIDSLTDQLGRAAQKPAGLLRVTLPKAYGASVVVPRLNELADAYADLQLEVTLTDRWADLMVEGFDVAVRIGTLPDSGLVARRIDSARFVTVASPGYLAAHGEPKDWAQLDRHKCLGFVMLSGRTRRWAFLDQARGEHELPTQFQLSMSDGSALVRCAENGQGIIQVPDYLAASAVHEGRLVELLPGTGTPASDIFCLHQPSRAMASRVRTFVDFIHGVATRRARMK